MDDVNEVNLIEKKNRLVDMLEPVLVAYLYIIAVIQPYLGLVLGIVLMKKAGFEKNRRLGKNVTIVSVVLLAVWLLCCIAYFAIIIVASIATKPAYY